MGECQRNIPYIVWGKVNVISPISHFDGGVNYFEKIPYTSLEKVIQIPKKSEKIPKNPENSKKIPFLEFTKSSHIFFK